MENDSELQRRLTGRLMSLSAVDSYSWAFNKYFYKIKQFRVGILVVWLSLLIWGAATGFDYIKGAKDEMQAPAGSRAANDLIVFENEFDALAHDIMFIVYIECLDKDCLVTCKQEDCGSKKCEEKANKEVYNFSKSVTEHVFAYSKKHDVGVKDEVLSYYELEGTNTDAVKCQFASQTGRSTFLTYAVSDQVESSKRYDLIGYLLDDLLPSINPDSKRYKVGVTGTDAVTRDGSGAAVKQSETIDAVTMPFAFMLLALMVRSWRLLLLALLNMGIALLTSFGILNVLTNLTNKPPLTTTASFVEVLVLGFSVDYSLFLLRRFRDECKSGRHPEVATKIMLAQAGHVVLMSSLTIICVFAGFIFLRSTDLVVQGMACVVSVSMCLLVNMTNTPAMLLLFPHFFSTFTATSACCTRKETRSTVTSVSSSSPGNENTDILLEHDSLDDVNMSSINGLNTDEIEYYLTSPSNTRTNKARGGAYEGWYFRFLKLITKWPYNLITLGLLYVCVLPLAYKCTDIRRNQNLLEAIPRGSQATSTYKAMFDSFPGGTLSPLYIIVDAPDGVLNPESGPKLFQDLVDLSKAIADATEIPVESMSSIAFAEGNEIGTKKSKIPFGMVKKLLKPESLFCKGLTFFSHQHFCDLYSFAWEKSVNEDQTATLITIILPFSPFTSKIENFINEVYNVIDDFENPDRLHFSGVEVQFVEDMKISFGEFPLLIAITCIVVFSLLGVMLKSAFVVIRLTMTVLLPLAAIFGLAVIVYQDGALNWTGIAQLQSHEDGFYWYVPLLCFTMCIGLALDYDVLVISRIREHRVAGYEIRAAIIKAIWEINSTVVCAGLIMALAFGGLLLSDSLAVNQMSWLLTTSVLFDTFVVQMIAVPAIMSLADWLSWWPGKVPTGNLVTLEEEVDARNRVLEQEANLDPLAL